MSTTKVVPGMLVAAPLAADVAREACSRIAKALREAIRARGKASLALSGGETPRATYEALAREEGIAWPSVDVFFVDERAVPPDHPRSNYKLVRTALLDPAHVPAHRTHRMPGEAKDLDEAARDYEALLRAKLPLQGGVPVLDVAVLGVGDDGHTASLFPGEDTVEIKDRLAVAVPAKGEREARLTLTAPVLIEARTAFVIVIGAKKTAALEAIWSLSGSRKQTPARILREAKNGLVWIIDKAAGGLG
jgi:6-phosphogluconolactonase